MNGLRYCSGIRPIKTKMRKTCFEMKFEKINLNFLTVISRILKKSRKILFQVSSSLFGGLVHIIYMIKFKCVYFFSLQKKSQKPQNRYYMIALKKVIFYLVEALDRKEIIALLKDPRTLCISDHVLVVEFFILCLFD